MVKNFKIARSEVNNPLLITFQLINQNVRKALFTCVVYTNKPYYLVPGILPWLMPFFPRRRLILHITKCIR